MDAKLLARDLNEGFQSALASYAGNAMTREEVSEILRACANNAAQALADRTISEETADRIAEHVAKTGRSFDLEEVVKDELFEAKRALK